MEDFTRALWVEAESEAKPLATRAGIRALFECAKRLNVTDLYIQVYRACRAWFNSSVADCSPCCSALREGFDPLEECLRKAEESNLKIHAWINIFNAGLNPERIKQIGPEARVLLYDNLQKPIDRWIAGTEELHRFSLDTPALWLDPASSDVERFLPKLVEELFAGYPKISGLHLDFFRYPYVLPIKPWSASPCGFDFGYSPSNIAAFKKMLAARDMEFSNCQDGALIPANETTALRWDNWRRFQITKYLTLFRAHMPASAVLSSAVLPWADRAYLSAFQNWRSWLAEGLIDQVLLMSYTRDNEHFCQMVRQGLPFAQEKRRLLAGIGLYKLERAEDLSLQERLAREAGAGGVCIFSYGELSRRGY